MNTSTSERFLAWEDLDHVRAAALVASHLPDASTIALQPLGQGDDCLAFRFGSRVVRVARHRGAADALKREACVLAQIAPVLPLPVPRTAHHAPHACPPFSVHDEIRGDVLTREKWRALRGPAWDRAATDMASFLRALHGVPAGIGERCGATRLDAAAFAERLRHTMVDTIRESLGSETWRQLDTMLEHWASLRPDPARAALLHGDIAPGHVLYDPRTGGLTGVIDFGDIALGEPARDFIYLYEDFGSRILEAVLARYASDGEGPTLTDIRKWYLLEATAWTIDAFLEGRAEDLDHGLSEMARELSPPALSARPPIS